MPVVVSAAGESGTLGVCFLRVTRTSADGVFWGQCWEDREGRKNMSKNNSKSLATLRQKLRKYSKDYEADITRYRENPEEEDEERDEDDEKGKLERSRHPLGRRPHFAC